MDNNNIDKCQAKYNISLQHWSWRSIKPPRLSRFLLITYQLRSLVQHTMMNLTNLYSTITIATIIIPIHLTNYLSITQGSRMIQILLLITQSFTILKCPWWWISLLLIHQGSTILQDHHLITKVINSIIMDTASKIDNMSSVSRPMVAIIHLSIKKRTSTAL